MDMQKLTMIVCLALAAAGTWGCQRELAVVRQEHAQEEMNAWASRSRRLEQPLTLEEAVRLAVTNNLQYRLARLEREIETEAERGAIFRMMPTLYTDGEYRWLSELRIASSEAADTGRTSLEPSFSSERDQWTGGFELAWSLLDFGIAFFKARQEENQGRILDERIRRTAQTLALEVTRAYYRAVVADAAVSGSRALLEDFRVRQKMIQEQIERGAVSEIEGLKNEEALATVAIRLQDFEKELVKAKLELADLLGLAPGSEFGFPPAEVEALPARIALDLPALEKEALANRPDLYESDLKGMIAEDEVRAKVAALFPSPAGFFGGEYDSNKFLRHQAWLTAGARISWDLFSIPRKASEAMQAMRTEDLVREQRLVLASGVLVQTHLAAIEYEDAWRQHELARDLAGVRDRILAASQRLWAQGQLDEGEVLHARADALFARLRHMNAYGELHVARRRVESSVGRDPIPLPPPPFTMKSSTGEEASEGWHRK